MILWQPAKGLTVFLATEITEHSKKNLKFSVRSVADFRVSLESKTANTTALNHCVDCNHVKQSRRLTKQELEGGGSQMLFVAYSKWWAQAFLHSHSCESMEFQRSL